MQAVLAGALFERLRSAAPGLDLRVRPLTLDSAREAQRGAIELAVLPDLRSQYAIPALDELVLSVQYTRRFVTVSRRRRKLNLAGFLAAEHVLVSPQGEEGGYVDDSLRLLGQRRRVAVAVPSFLAALALVQSSELVATLPEDVLIALAPRLPRQPCPVITPTLPMCIGWAARFGNDARHRWLREQLRQVLAARLKPSK
jgi:DNA-binding transcriptional LysR family regulator